MTPCPRDIFLVQTDLAFIGVASTSRALCRLDFSSVRCSVSHVAIWSKSAQPIRMAWSRAMHRGHFGCAAAAEPRRWPRRWPQLPPAFAPPPTHPGAPWFLRLLLVAPHATCTSHATALVLLLVNTVCCVQSIYVPPIQAIGASLRTVWRSCRTCSGMVNHDHACFHLLKYTCFHGGPQ